MLLVAIDGACRRNGKPDCVSAGGAVIIHLEDNLQPLMWKALTAYEVHSTNQRGELLALLTSLDYIYEASQDAQIITDSEYIFNAMLKDWCGSWSRKGWITMAGEPVKNRDIWQEIANTQRRCADKGIDLMFYHIKGHCMSFGKVTAAKLIHRDNTCQALYEAVNEKLSTVALKPGVREQVRDLSIKNNGFPLADDVAKRFIALNTVADALATKCVEAADALL